MIEIKDSFGKKMDINLNLITRIVNYDLDKWTIYFGDAPKVDITEATRNKIIKEIAEQEK